MSVNIEKVSDLPFNEMAVLHLIEKDEDLSSIFLEDTNLSMNMVKTLSLEGNLPDKVKVLIFDIFDKLILTKKNFANKYGRILDLNKIEERKLDEVKKLPRRFGKEKIKKIIEKQGGRPTPQQLAALELNDLKNIIVILNNKLIKDMLTNSPVLSTDDYKIIRSAVQIFKSKTKTIVKKKR